jgi:uncharacterized protein with von Willebrand factor type A (vWA) domain
MIIKNVSKWERSQKDSFQKSSQRLQAKVVEGKEKGYDFNEFSQDLFSSLYQARPQLGDATRGTQWAKQALEVMGQLREYKDLRTTGTCGNSFQAGLGTIALTSHFANLLPVHQTRNPDKIVTEIRAVEDWIHELEENNRPSGEATKKSTKLRQELEEAAGEWDQPLDEEGLRVALRKALVQAKEEAQQLEGETEAFGFGDGPGKDGFTSPELKLALAQKVQNNAKLRQIAELAGRFKREARKVQANKKRPGPDEVTDIEMGDAIQRVIPAELMLLGDDLLKVEFMRKFAEKGLIQYRLDEPDSKSKGPVVVCIDDSGSMSGHPEVWSKAIALAMARIATDQKRAFALIHFDTQVARVDHFPAGKVDPEKLIDSCAFFTGGGTNFEPALQEAFGLIDKGASGAYKKADIIFITDGEAAAPSEATLKLKKATGATLYGICIGCDSQVLKDISDHYTEVRDLTDDGDIKEAIFSV